MKYLTIKYFYKISIKDPSTGTNVKQLLKAP